MCQFCGFKSGTPFEQLVNEQNKYEKNPTNLNFFFFLCYHIAWIRISKLSKILIKDPELDKITGFK